MKRNGKLTIATLAAMLTVLGGTAIYAQDKYTLVTTSGIAFSDFKGYEDWAVVSSARTNEILKVIVANPIMIAAYKSGVPGNGQAFPGWLQDSEAAVEPEEGVRRPRSTWMYRTRSHRLSSSKRTARDFRTAADGDMHCSTTRPRPTRSQPIPAPQIADTRAMWP